MAWACEGTSKIDEEPIHTDSCFVHGFSAGRVAVSCCWEQRAGECHVVTAQVSPPSLCSIEMPSFYSFVPPTTLDSCAVHQRAPSSDINFHPGLQRSVRKNLHGREFIWWGACPPFLPAEPPGIVPGLKKSRCVRACTVIVLAAPFPIRSLA